MEIRWRTGAGVEHGPEAVRMSAFESALTNLATPS